MNKKYKWVFWGTPQISVYFLEELKRLEMMPDLVVTNPDAPVGRKKVLTPSLVSLWADKNGIKILKPEKLDEKFLMTLNETEYDFFFVLAYGKILKPKILDIPKYGILNLHPSLLPQYRGPSPIMSATLDDQKETGVSLMLLDEKMDHGPIIAQEKIEIIEWEKNEILEKQFAEVGAKLFHKTLTNKQGLFVKNTREQNHNETTYCQKYTKEDMELTHPLNSRKNFLKYCAFSKPFFFDPTSPEATKGKQKRNIVTDAEWKNDEFIIKKVIPEGKKEKEFKE